jgi:Collagen triple helix repeat (20 copies)
MYRKYLVSVAALAAISGIAVDAALAAPNQSTTIHACYSLHSRALSLASQCRRGERQLAWSQQGSPGAKGLTGGAGAAGTTGVAGITGNSGLPGVTGNAGVAGTNGAPGAAGVAGTPGAAGATGATGDTGPAGPAIVYTFDGTAHAGAHTDIGSVVATGSGTADLVTLTPPAGFTSSTTYVCTANPTSFGGFVSVGNVDGNSFHVYADLSGAVRFICTGY